MEFFFLISDERSVVQELESEMEVPQAPDVEREIVQEPDFVAGVVQAPEDIVTPQVTKEVVELSTSGTNKSPSAGSGTGVGRQKKQGRRAVRRDRTRVNRQNKKLKEEVCALQRKVWRLNKKLSKKKKENGSPQTPGSKMSKITQGQFLNKNVKRNLFKGLVVMEECKEAKKPAENQKGEDFMPKCSVVKSLRSANNYSNVKIFY